MTENYDKLKAQKDAIIAKQTVGTLHAHNEHQSACPHCRFANSEALVVEARARRLAEAVVTLADFALSIGGSGSACVVHHASAVTEARGLVNSGSLAEGRDG